MINVIKNSASKVLALCIENCLLKNGYLLEISDTSLVALLIFQHTDFLNGPFKGPSSK